MKQFYLGKKILFTLWLALIGLASFGQNSFNSGDGWGAGWGTGSSFSSSAGSSLIYTATNSSGAGNRYFRFYGNGTPCGEYGPSGSNDVQLSPETAYTGTTITCGSSKAFYLAVANSTDNWVFKSAGISSAKMIIFRVQGAIRSITGVSSSLSTVYANQSPTITATLNGALATGQGVYLRYTNDGFATSTVVPMTSATSTTYTASIPGQISGKTVNYYLFTAGTTTPSGADADWYTINLNNNGGSNYSYTVQTPPTPTITLGTNPTVCRGVTSANISYSATTNSPNQYSITFDATALGQGFASVSNAALPSSPIAITVPAAAAAGTYNGTLTVRNTATGGVSSNYAITVTVAALPDAGSLSGTLSFCLNGTTTLTSSGTSGGSWSSSNTSVASVNSSGVVTGAGVGTATITYTVTNGSGCSASATANVTVNANTSSSQTVTACDTYTWSVNGQTYTTSGTYTYVNACDTKTLNLTITPSSNNSTTASACGSYLWSVNGQTYTASGTYTSVSGCHTETLNLTITPNTSNTTTTSACDSYTWSVNGQTYTTSGTYTSVSGCHTEILNLTIYVSTPSSQTVSACDSYLWSVDGNTYTTSGTYVFEGTNAAGCPQDQTLYLTINSSSASSQTVTECDSYTWSVNGQTYTTSGTYTYVGTNASGCPDTKTLNLTINNSSASSQTVTACDSYTWSVNGQTYTSSGTYTYASTNASGCPDTKTLYLTVTPSTSNTTTISACGSYLWSVNGQTYTASGTYTSVSGCHTETLNLTITPNTSNTTTAAACDTYTWSVNGQTYTTSGTYTSVSGCHTEILALTINNSTSSSQTVSACDTYTWSVNGQTYTTSGTYTFTGTNASGCTDTKTLNLTINNTTASSQTVSACGSYTWSVNGQTYTTSGTYTNVGTNASGCTDTKTLNLTVSPINKSNAGTTWVNGQNDNTAGLGAWNLSTVGTTAGFFSGSSDINNGGTRSWGMFASGGSNVASAVRPVSMGVGNTISFSMDNGFIDTGKTIGFGLQNSAGQNLAELVFIGGQSTYRMLDANSANTSIGYTAAGLDISLTYTGTNTYTITIAARGGSSATYTGRTFTTQSGGQVPAQIRFFNAGAGTGSSYDLFFNSLAITNPIITTQPAATAQNICVGTTPTNLTVAAGGAGLTYQWYSNTLNGYTGGTSLGSANGAQTATLTPQNTTPGILYYYCVVTDPCGSAYSAVSGAVTVTSPPNAGALSGTQEVCVNGLTTFSTNGTTGGSWSTSNSAVATVNTSGGVTGIASGSATITYTLNGTGGCSNATATRTVTVNALPTATITADGPTSFCEGGSVVLTAGESTSYLWSTGATTQSITVTASGNYTVQVTNANGCSATSGVTTVTVTPNTTHTVTTSACDTYTWSVNGQTYTESGTYSSVSGCHTEVLVLTITPSTSNTNVVSACDTYTWSVNGQTYTTGGTYNFVSGCHTEILELTINHSTSSSQSVAACDTYTWAVNNQTYTESGTYTFEGTNEAGCTDTKILILTINKSTVSSESVTACDSYTWPVDGQTYTQSGTYTYASTNASGCPDTKTLVLTINESITDSQTITACESYTWSQNNQTYTQSGTYTKVDGCTTYELNLTINPAIQINAQPENTVLCSDLGSTAVVEVGLLQGAAGVTYQWQFSEDNGGNWTTIDESNAAGVYTTFTTNSLTITKTLTMPVDGTLYRVIISDGICDDVISNSAVLRIYGLTASELSGATRVCAGDNSTTLTLAAGSVGDIQWKYWDEANQVWVALGASVPAASLGAINPQNTLTVTNLTQGTWYKVVLSNGYCQPIETNSVRISVSQPAVGGTITGGGVTVCSGDNATTLTLEGSSGTRVWQKSTDYDVNNPNNATWLPAGSSALTLNVNNSNVTTWYRVVLSSETCPTAYSNVVTITAAPALVKKAVSGTATVCYGSNSTSLTLAAGTVGNVQWQSSTDDGLNWTNAGSPVAATAPTNPEITYTAVDLTQTTLFRVLLTNEVCTPLTTVTAEVTVTPAVVAGEISGGNVSVCSANNSTVLSLQNYSGAVIRWQKATTQTGTYTTISGATTATYTPLNLTATTWFRAQVSSPACTTVYTTPVVLTVVPNVKGGTISSATSVCLGNDITFTLTGYAGTSFQWQSSPISTSTTPGVFTDIPGATGTSYTLVGATADVDKSYRVLVTNSCNNTTAYSAVKTIKVDPTSVAGNLTSGGGVVCAGSNGTLKVAGYVGKIQWQYSTDGENYVNAPKAADGQTVPFGTTSVSSTAATYLVTGIATELWFRARVTSGACSSSYTSAAHYTIGTAALVGGITPASTTLCPGTGTTLTLTGAVGVITWQKSTTWTSATPTWISSTNHTDTFATGNLTVSTAYRAMVTIGSCSTVYSDLAYVYVVAKPLAKTIVANTTTPSGKTALTALCTNDVSKILTVGAGSIGSVQWQWSTTSTTSGFTDIVGATGNSYVVTNPAVGANYFRVKMSNTCGVEVFGTAITVWYKDCTPAKAEVKVPFNVVAYPNPYTANFNLSLTTSSVDTVGVAIYDMTGKLIDQRTVRPSEVSDLQVGDRYPSGVYNVVVTQGSEVKTLRVIKR
ncbi:T9SS type A sorting domain-containing protein [Flavobacterium sp. XGLA_31]|uniref:T9SS type A sorting domain-containing protein n=1 Tax=Flavobacterium sp. XGLA_31 TaxID=3447666 RepID=UPI003F2D1844